MRDKIDQLESQGRGLLGKAYKNPNESEQDHNEMPEDHFEMKKQMDRKIR